MHPWPLRRGLWLSQRLALSGTASLNSTNLMHFLKTLTAITAASIVSAAPVHAAQTIGTQMPKINFDGAHKTTNWDPSSLNRVRSLNAELAKACGVASWYGVGDGFAGRRTASGQIFDPHAMTTAHRSLPFGTKIKVVNQANGKTVVVTGTDRGPYIAGRVLDLSYGAFSRIASPSQGTASVCYTRIS